VFCDRSNLTFIELLNTEAKNRGIKWISFKAAPQIEVLFRVNFKQGLLGANMLNVSLITNEFMREMAVAT